MTDDYNINFDFGREEAPVVQIIQIVDGKAVIVARPTTFPEMVEFFMDKLGDAWPSDVFGYNGIPGHLFGEGCEWPRHSRENP